jgi:uncharacterized membrane protein YgdD (TMEM256/DUF423 family)
MTSIAKITKNNPTNLKVTNNLMNHPVPKNRFFTFLIGFVGISGCFSVLFGAWLAHAGQQLPIEVQVRLASALQYQFIHTLALLAVLIWYQCRPSKTLVIAALCFVAGIFAFSGSLYLKTFLMLDVIGKVAPLGGILLAIAWVFVAIAGKTVND